PIYTFFFIAIVAAVCYGILNTIPSYINIEQKQITSLKNELKQKRKTQALVEYQQRFESLYAPLETSISETTFDQPSKVMDEVRKSVKEAHLDLIDLSRSGGGSSGWVSEFLEKTNVVEINLIVQGDVNPL